MLYKEHENQHLRLTILRTLKVDTDYQINESLLRDAIKVYGFGPSRDALRVQLRWLGALLVARLTERGADVAIGAATVDGVKRPGP